MKNKEIIIIIVIVLIALGGAAAFYFINITEAPLFVRVTRNGSEIFYAPVSENTTRVLTDDAGYNTLVIKDGQVSISEADCPEQVCVNTHWITSPGETIVCLPHRLIVEIVPGD